MLMSETPDDPDDSENFLVFDNEVVTKTTEGWSYKNLQYWMKGFDYFFGAVSPVNHKDVTVKTQTMSETGLGTISFKNEKGDVDLLYAFEDVYNGEINVSAPEKVGFQFAHLLSRVKFSFKYNFPNELTTVAVENIKINNSPAEGSIDVTVARAGWTWVIPQNGNNVVLDFGHVEGAKQFAELDTYYGSDKYCLMIPTDESRPLNITFDIVFYQNGERAYTYSKESNLAKTFVQGKSYNIVAEITPKELELKPIEFKVIEVQGWEDGDVAAPITLASPAVEATVAENVVTLKWDAIEGAAYYTVKVGDLTENVEGTSYVFTGDYATEYEFSVVAVPAEGMNIEASEAAVVTATTEAKPVVAPATLTVAEFLAAAEGTTVYELTGVIKNVANTNYGNFDLQDETGTVYVYGLYDESGNKVFTSLGLKEGDTLTMRGVRTSYNDVPQVGSGVYVSHVVSAEQLQLPFAHSPLQF